MIINDAHIHIGIFPSQTEQSYLDYSPEVIYSYISNIGIKKYIFSSAYTLDANFNEEVENDLIRQMLYFGKGNAFAFYWVTQKKFLQDDKFSQIDKIDFKGLKLHSRECEWIKHPKKLERIMDIAKEREMAVILHCDDDYPPHIYEKYYQKYSEVKINIAHARPLESAMKMLNRYDNVYTDISFSPIENIKFLMSIPNISNRIMFGSDMPAPESFFNDNCCSYVQHRINQISKELSQGLDKFFHLNMMSFLKTP